MSVEYKRNSEGDEVVIKPAFINQSRKLVSSQLKKSWIESMSEQKPALRGFKAINRNIEQIKIRTITLEQEVKDQKQTQGRLLNQMKKPGPNFGMAVAEFMGD